LPCAFHKPIYRYGFRSFPVSTFFVTTSIFQLWDLVKLEAFSVVEVLWPIYPSDLDETFHLSSIRQSTGMIFLLFPISTFFVKNFNFPTMGHSQIRGIFSCEVFMADLSVRFGWNLLRAFHTPIYRYDFLPFNDFHFFRQKLHFSKYGTLSNFVSHTFSCRCFMADLSIRFRWNLPCAFHTPVYRYDFHSFSNWIDWSGVY